MSNYLDLLQYGQKATEDYAAIIEKQLAKAWLEAYKQVDSDLAVFMARFGDLEEAQKYNRLVGLKSSIAEQFKSLTGKAIDGTADISENSYTTAFQSTWYSLEQTTRLGLDFGVIPVDAIRASVYSQISGADFATRFGKLYTSTVDKVAESITRAMATGQGYAKTAREIKSLWEGSFFNAIRVIRTESTRNFTEGSVLAYEKADQQGIKGTKTWLATKDFRTRPDHARLNGKQSDKNGYFYIGSDKAVGPGMFSQPENAINCRCSTYYKLKGFEKDYTPDWTYSQWEREFGDWQKLPRKTGVQNVPSTEIREKILNYKPKNDEKLLRQKYSSAIDDHEKEFEKQIARGMTKKDMQDAYADKNNENHEAALKMYKLEKERTKAYRAWSNSEENMIKEYKKLLEVNPSNRFEGDIIATVINGKKTKAIKDGEAFIKSITNKDRLEELKIFVDNKRFPRASYSDKYKMVLGPKTINASTVAHEIAHSIEYNSKKLSDKSKSFLKKRAWNEKPKKLRDLTNDKGYRDDEFTYEDEFLKRGGDHYSGKIYDDNATELVSTGVQRLLKNPLKFAQQDPEYFDFVIDILQGEI